MFTKLRAPTKALPRILARRAMGTAALPKVPLPSSRRFLDGKTMRRIGAFGLGLGAAQYYLGSAENFFEHKFITHKKPEDLADFYGAGKF